MDFCGFYTKYPAPGGRVLDDESVTPLNRAAAPVSGQRVPTGFSREANGISKDPLDFFHLALRKGSSRFAKPFIERIKAAWEWINGFLLTYFPFLRAN